MNTLSTELRNKLERTCIAARNLAETAANAALEAVAVQHTEAYAHMTREQKDLRNKLRAHARQLGDVQDTKGNLALGHLAHECAYEHWHRMLFARFLAENSLLIPPELGTPVTLEECKELAKEAKTNLWALAGRYAQAMLPEVFRADDPVLQVPLAREDQLKLEAMLNDLPAGVFTASDSLGWCYQFWQAERKDEVNASGNKIGADELPSVTQLFTEDYMVDFLLDNTLGAWWWGRQKAEGGRVKAEPKTEEECRKLIALPGCPWKYLRFVKDEKSGWRPAAGTFEGWPKTAKELKCLDPCMGSGHFVVAMFERLVALRIADDNLDEKDAVAAVIRDNLFGLEIDPRCTQIAAFNLALAAWRRVGHCPLHGMNLACSGLAPNARKEDWLKLAGKSEKLQRGMERLYQLFQKAPELGSLINPRVGEGDLLIAAFHELQPLMEKAFAQESDDDSAHELAVAARGMAKAAELLSGQFTLVATNVPYLGRSKQGEILKEHLESFYTFGRSDLATGFVLRCMEFCAPCGSTALVSTQYWLFLATYKKLRKDLITRVQWDHVARLGAGAFETISGEVVNVALLVLTAEEPTCGHEFSCIDVSAESSPDEKAVRLLSGSIARRDQNRQLSNPDQKIVLEDLDVSSRFGDAVEVSEGLHTGDYPRFGRKHWEVCALGKSWAPQQGGTEASDGGGGCEHILLWEGGAGQLIQFVSERLDGQPLSMWIKGESVWGRRGVSVGTMSALKHSPYYGAVFTHGIVAVVPNEPLDLPAVYAFCESDDFRALVRQLDQKVCVARASFEGIPFDLAHWQKVAAKRYPKGLPTPFSNDPTQWLFDGHPKGSDNPLHVAVARLLGYQWPRQTGSSFPDCPALGADGLEKLADNDGIVCIPSVRGEEPAADRLRKLLAAAYGKEWKPTSERDLIRAAGSEADDFDEWLRDDFFEQHCDLFHQRPFLWHIWDGRKRDGFHVIVNYHKLAGPKGRKLLESLTFAYLGEWITKQKDSEKRGEDGAEERLAAALELKKRLEAILEGNPPFDLFVRWKPLAKQAIGWEPDINDGVRMNIRPFLADDLPKGKKGAGILRAKPGIKWDKDRGKEPAREKKEFPWFWAGGKFTGDRLNDVHLTNDQKQRARKE